jgi:hypothetical protein
MGLNVVVVGGGIGGLALAQGLRGAGVDVAVFERDRTPTDRMQGYRVHINRAGSRALHACLPPPLFEAFVETAAAPNPRAGISMYDHRMRELIWFGAGGDPAVGQVDGGTSVSRVSLRQVLLAGLDDIVHFDKTFTHYHVNPDTAVTAHFDDGTTACGACRPPQESVPTPRCETRTCWPATLPRQQPETCGCGRRSPTTKPRCASTDSLPYARPWPTCAANSVPRTRWRWPE